MKIIFLMLFSAISINSFSQTFFPDLSPRGILQQKVGFETIKVDYARPAARGRKVFGELIPYGKLWRTGASNCSKIKFSGDVTIANKKISAGSYSLFTIPGANEWTIILNSDTTIYGLTNYSESKDIIRFKTKVENANRHYESFTMEIDVVPNNAILYLAWEHTRISFPIETQTDSKVNEFVEQNLLTDKSKDADQYGTGAEYYYFLNKNLDRALLLIDKAIIIKSEAWLYGLKIDILGKQKNYKSAIEFANHAIDLVKNQSWDAETKNQSIVDYKGKIEILNRSKDNKLN